MPFHSIFNSAEAIACARHVIIKPLQLAQSALDLLHFTRYFQQIKFKFKKKTVYIELAGPHISFINGFHGKKSQMNKTKDKIVIIKNKLCIVTIKF